MFEVMEDIRRKLFLDVKEFCNRLGITRSSYYNYKNNKRSPAFYVRKKIFEMAKENGFFYNINEFFE